MSRANNTRRGFLDRDFVSTKEGFLFCVIGGIHPLRRVLAYLKYRSAPRGSWGKTTRYSRTMQNYTIPSLQANLHLLMTTHPHYIYDSNVLNTQISAVPRECIVQHYKPEHKLVELFHIDQRDSLQSVVVQLVSTMSRQTAIPREDFGITGSILTDIHQPDFSDIDLTIYGLRNGWKIRQYLQTAFQDPDSLFTRHSEEARRQVVARWSRRYPLTRSEAEQLYIRRWNYGFFHNTPFSIHPVQPRIEVGHRYGDRCFSPIRMIEGVAKIVDVQKSLFMPGSYGITDFDSTDNGNDVVVRQIISFNGLYNGIFEAGETVRVRGKLEKAEDKRRHRTYYRILVGSLLAKGQDYIKPLD